MTDSRPIPRRFGVELVLVVVVALATFVPGIHRYSLVDPWETHYGEVGRNMLVDNDFVLTQWPGTNLEDQANEGFRSKPVLSFWLMAAGMKALGIGHHGGYSGEMTESPLTMVAIRLPFILCGTAGLALLWLMLARLTTRRLAWLALLTVGTTPFFCLVVRQAIPDMPLTACVIGAIALFTLAVEDGDRAITRWEIKFKRGVVGFDARHVVLGLFGAFVILQVTYDAVYFLRTDWAMRGGMPHPSVMLPILAIVLLGMLHSTAFYLLRVPLMLFGIPFAKRVPRDPHAKFPTLARWERHALDRMIIRVLVLPITRSWSATSELADKALAMRPITKMGQVYMLGCYALLGVSILAKGPPGLTVVGIVGVLHVLVLGRWKQLADGMFEIKRGIAFALVIFLPWHLAIWAKAGFAWVNEYVFTHVLNRATTGVDNSPGTFEYYSSQLGHGMWLWAALLPAAVAAGFLRARRDTVEGRVRFMIALWAVAAVALFCIVQTKFHHYILPAIPPLAILVAFLLDDLWTRRERLHPLLALLGVGIVFLVGRDLMFEPDRWIEMFVFRYDRAWPHADPWAVDTSDAFLGLAIAGSVAVLLLATRLQRLGVIITCVVGFAICMWSLHAYMPHAGTHWGMREAMRKYYEMRTIYGQTLVYFDRHQFVGDWGAPRETWTFDTMISDTVQIGQPMALTIQLRKPEDERIIEQTIVLAGTASAIGDHSITVKLAPGERAKLVPHLKATGPKLRRRPLYAVDADRLIAWQLYWRGEQFWSGGEIWDYLPEMKTSFPPTNNKEFQKYVADRARMPLGRRYYLVTDSGRLSSVKGMLPTPRAKETFQVLDTTSNKFSLAAFDM